MKSVNVLVFPGTNCARETSRAIRQAGFSSQIFRWNSDFKKIDQSDGLVIAGGFSFEDRGRSGVISALSPVSSVIRCMAEEGKPILGICNGAQILVEMGLVPGFYTGITEMSLARNRRQDASGVLGSGFFHDFIFLKPGEKRCAWTNFDEILKLPIAHGEGRFLANNDVISSVRQNGQASLLYCNKEGALDSHFPVNPNGSLENLAAVSNDKGNVMAMMPHPERVEGGQKIFKSLHIFFKNKKEDTHSVLPNMPKPFTISKKKEYSIEIYVSLKITDNTEKTLELAAKNIFLEVNASLKRQQFWGILTRDNPFIVAEKLLQSNEFLNENKETALFRIGSDWFLANGGRLLTCSPPQASPSAFLLQEKDDILGQEKQEILQKHENLDVSLSSGVLWSFSKPISEDIIVHSSLFGNPVNWILSRI